MYVRMDVCVCICIYMYVCTYIRMYVNVCNVCMFVCTLPFRLLFNFFHCVCAILLSMALVRVKI